MVQPAQDSVYEPNEEEKKLYSEFLAESHKRELASTDNFDKSILTLSSAGLGLSISFLKDFGGQGVVSPIFLFGSWVLFVVATLSTMLSFLSSIKGLEFGKETAHRGYRLGDYTAFDRMNAWEKRTICLNYISATAFCLALVFTIVFVITNVRVKNMPANTNTQGEQLLQKGLTTPTLQRPASAPASPPAQPAAAPTSAPTTNPSAK